MFVQNAELCLEQINKRAMISKAPFVGALFDLFLPNRCLICSKLICSEEILCWKCIDALKTLSPSGTLQTTPSIEKIYIFDDYDSPLTDLIKAYKYGSHKILERFLGYFLALLLAYWALPKTIVPIPSHRQSRRTRGFSSMENIVSRCKQDFDPEITPLNALKRLGEYIPQASLSDPIQRKANALKAYALCEISIPEELVLVDDVMTSGNTLEAVAKIIKSKRTDCRISGAVFVKRGR
ncbi:MAG TPA: hypothetical protein P5107_05015 [Thermotogota bacterium]|nr:hypothetical protein [Thermotogota bacterium]HRW34396.1 hypothetical protein [Thermotogota bacterium]